MHLARGTDAGREEGTAHLAASAQCGAWSKKSSIELPVDRNRGCGWEVEEEITGIRIGNRSTLEVDAALQIVTGTGDVDDDS